MEYVFMCLPVYFDYGGKTWLMEFWKGGYGITAGGFKNHLSVAFSYIGNETRFYTRPFKVQEDGRLYVERVVV